MFGKKNKVYVSALIVIVYFVSCKPDIKKLTGHNSNKITFTVGDVWTAKPLNLGGLIENVRYLVLENTVQILGINEIKSLQENILITDRLGKKILIYSTSGKFLKLIPIDKDDVMNVGNDFFYIYNIKNGLLEKFDSLGQKKATKKIGFRGLEIASDQGNRLIFYTAGISNSEVSSKEYYLTISENNLNSNFFGIAIADGFKGVEYLSSPRFASDGAETYFVSPFENEMYVIGDQMIQLVYKFDFGRANISEEIFASFKKVSNYYEFPYVFDISCRAINENFVFITFLFKGKEGYILIDRNNKIIKRWGIGIRANIETDLFNPIPLGTKNKSFLSPIKLKSMGQDQLELFKKINRKNISMYNCSTKSDYVIMIYDLK